MVKFITLAGRKQTGKDTSARYIKQIVESQSTSKVHILHFADALKTACSVIFDIPLSDMETETGKQKKTDVKWPTPSLRRSQLDTYEVVGYEPYHPRVGKPEYMTVREVLQFVGTNLLRNQMDPNIWVKSVYRKQYADDDIVVVADCRFPNEADFAKEHGILIHIERETGLDKDEHVSEIALDHYDGYDAKISNNGSFQDLRDQLEKILFESLILGA